MAWLAPGALLYAGLAAWFAGWLRTGRGVRTPYTRKVFHFLIFTAAGVVQLLWGLGGVVVFGTVVAGAVLFAVARGDGFPFYEALARPSDAPHRSLFVLVPLVMTALGGVLSNLLFPGFAQVGYMVTGWGDAVGEPVGVRWGEHRYTVPSLAGVPAERSLEGSTAVLLTGFVAAWLVLGAGGMGWGAAVLPAAGCAAVGAAVEAASNHGLDNLTIQVAASGVAYWILA